MLRIIVHRNQFEWYGGYDDPDILVINIFSL